MQLVEAKPYVETSGQLKEKLFSVGDYGMVFDILRNKMYSNPILAICREISCNARDAHREVGKHDVPIQIQLPNAIESFYKIKDFGPGINPDRIENIFIKYGVSTKRDNNIQTGAFGMGAKTPFSYSDTFSIITNCDGVKYNYACFIDETKVGKIALLSKHETNEPNGTEIIIPVKSSDYNLFRDATEQSTRFWKIKPDIKGDLTYNAINFILEGSNWAIYHNTDYNYRQVISLIIDGISYPLDHSFLNKSNHKFFISGALKGNLLIYINNGEISLSANREQIYLDQKTKDVISSKLNDLVSEIKQNAINKINSFDNLWDAQVYYVFDLKANFHSLDFLGHLQWNNIDLVNYFKSEIESLQFVKTKSDRIERGIQRGIKFLKNSQLYINDISEECYMLLTSKHVKHVFEKDDKLTSIQIINPTANTTIKNLNEKYHLNKMKCELLSSIIRTTIKAPKPTTSKILTFLYDNEAHTFNKIKFSDFLEDSEEKVICPLNKKNTNYNSYYTRASQYIYFDGSSSTKSVNFQQLSEITKAFPDVKFYGMQYDYIKDKIKDISNCLSLEDFIIKKYLVNKEQDYVLQKTLFSNDYDSYSNGTDYMNFLKNKSTFERFIKLISKNSDFYKFITYCESLNLIDKIYNRDHMYHKNFTIVQLYDTFMKNGNDIIKKYPEHNFIMKNSLIKAKYPILAYIDRYQIPPLEIIANYINLIDKETT